jgi:hypothetical protein
MMQNVARVLVVCVSSAWMLGGPMAGEVHQSRGVGVYPGDPTEDFSPLLVVSPAGRRNLALHRATLQSSAYDYNSTAQLLTDGIVSTTLPRWVSITTSAAGAIPKHERELILDDNVLSGIDLDVPGWIEIELGGGEEPLVIDRVEIGMRNRNWFPLGPPFVSPSCIGSPWGPPVSEQDDDEDIAWTLTASEDGREWTDLGEGSATVPPRPSLPPLDTGFGRIFNWLMEANPPVWTSVTLDQPVDSRRFRLNLEDLECKEWQLVETRFYRGEQRVRVGGPWAFSSAWRSGGLGKEWVSVDLGARSTIDHLVLHWLLPPGMGTVQVSDDGEAWSKVADLSGNDPREEVQLVSPVAARYVRVLMTQPRSPEGYVLSELEVFGEGGLVAEPHPQPPAAADGSLHLAGGNWRLQRDSQVAGDGSTISTVGYDDGGWVVATVPATVLTSYFNIGAVPDLNFGANELVISDSFFHADFWYRNEFDGPNLSPGQRAFLELDGVNWKAEVFLNGQPLGRVEGAFTRGRFDVTEQLRPAERNALAIRVEKPANPGSAKQHTLADAGHNGGALGADNPTYHASIGWDWIPTIRGRNIGLWNDVRLAVTGPVTLEDPWIHFTLPLPDTSSADLHLEVTLTNHGDTEIEGTLQGTFGEVSFEQGVQLPAATNRTIRLDPSTHPQLRLQQPRLWWPNGYGEPHLYDVELKLLTGSGISDETSFHTGVRQMTYREENEALHFFVNGRRIVPRGGNWGFPEANLRYRGREYDIAMRYHRDMNFTMVRNWVGQTADDEFYEAADRNGILIWQDFWLANPLDGPDPDDEELFMRNVRDTLRRIRNHPSIALYCGRNEGHPPAPLDAALAAAIEEAHGEIHYIPNSIFGTVSGGGPYGVRPREYYFTERATPKPHSELGMTSVVTLDSLRDMMPDSEIWPMGLQWGLHDFNLESNQRAEDFVAMIEEAYGGADELVDWVSLAQLVNYDGYRAMFEAQSEHRMGLQLWMSHPAWPSLTWQTYDYYFNPHAAYFGARKGSEPLHIQWHPVTDAVEVVNYGVVDTTGLIAKAQVLQLDGSLAWESEARIDSAYDSTVSPFTLEFPSGLTPVHFIRLRLELDGDTISENFYWRGTDRGDYRALRTLPRISLLAETRSERQGDRYLLRTQIENATDVPALAVRVVAVGAESGERILPALYSDNFVPLMPGETRAIETELKVNDTRGETPRILIEGFNVATEVEMRGSVEGMRTGSR